MIKMFYISLLIEIMWITLQMLDLTVLDLKTCSKICFGVGKQRGEYQSDHQSVHSGSTSVHHRPPSTLYHDNLTYRYTK